jgi:hypothetical protein
MGKDLPILHVDRKIYRIRGRNVMMDSDLAELYGVETKVLLQSVRRNCGRFPADFRFQLSIQEVRSLRSQFVTSNPQPPEFIETFNDNDIENRGGRRGLPYVFTEQGIAMLSSVLKSERAVQVNIQIMRSFVRLREILASNTELAKKLEDLEKKYDGQFKIVFDAIRALMAVPEHKKRPIGFGR